MYDVIVIGGGATGLTAAIRASGRGEKVIVLEASNRVGKKILLAGSGKCNLSNINLASEHYNTPFVEKFLPKSNKVYEFFEEIGLKTRVIDGRIYPYSESGNSVLNLLRRALPENVVATDCPVEKISYDDGIFTVNGYKGRKVVLATGSSATVGRNSHSVLEKLGHKIIPLAPALVPLKCDVEATKGLSGIRAKVRLTVKNGDKEVFSDCGEILFRDGGVSGIVSMDASRYLQGGEVAEIDFAPDISEEDLKSFCDKHGVEGVVHRLVGEAVKRQSIASRKPIYEVLKRYNVGEVSAEGADRAQVMRGGLDVNDFSDNLESKIMPGLYAGGEALDVDGACGGYNLHWAFLSGLIIGDMV